MVEFSWAAARVLAKHHGICPHKGLRPSVCIDGWQGLSMFILPSPPTSFCCFTRNQHIYDLTRTPGFHSLLKYQYSDITATLCSYFILSLAQVARQTLGLMVSLALCWTQLGKLSQETSSQTHIQLWEICLGGTIRLYQLQATVPIPKLLLG